MKLDDQTHHIKKDKKGKIRQIDHTLSPYKLSQKAASDSPKDVAAQYIREVLNVKNVFTEKPTESLQKKRKETRKQESEIWFKSEKQILNIAVVEFEQRHNAIRVWKSGISVSLKSSIGDVVFASNTFDYEIPTIEINHKILEKHANSIDGNLLSKILLLDKNIKRVETIRKDIKEIKEIDIPKPSFKINNIEQVVYRYDPEARQIHEKPGKDSDRNLVARALELVLPDVNKKIKPFKHYVVTEVYFSASVSKFSMNWHALIEPETNSILYLRPLVAQDSGWVYEKDPLTTTGDSSITPGSSTAILNGPRAPKALPGITALPALLGEYVKMVEFCPPVVAAPTSIPGKFDYGADTDDFSAVNAYYHSDAVFRMVEEMGFDMGVYFDGTSFPVSVDHRGCCACVNAAAWSTGSGSGLAAFTFGLVEASEPVGIATDVRIVLHEFGHAILFDNVNDGSFGFSHSAGDSLAAILCDPRSKAPDRFLTFPWLTQSNPAIDRRHDRDIASGWAWGGVNDDGGYGSEQILSTSHFRAYRSLGGDHPDLCENEWAARYMAYLIIHGVGILTPLTNPNNPEDWADTLMLCDKTTPVFEGHPGGVVHKVIRWAFEKQGAYQPVGASMPVVTEGAPPAFDVYINDGRNGEYQFTTDYCHTNDIWNRICPDDNPAHQQPIAGIHNYAYVIVRNRGTENISGGVVKAFHKRDNNCCGCCDDCHELTWPNDFMPMITEDLSFGLILPGDYEIIGPFTWKPGPNDCLLMAVEAQGDPSNISIIEPGQSLRVKRFVPFDNNIALRCMCKQCNRDYTKLELKKPCA